MKFNFRVSIAGKLVFLWQIGYNIHIAIIIDLDAVFLAPGCIGVIERDSGLYHSVLPYGIIKLNIYFSGQLCYLLENNK